MILYNKDVNPQGIRPELMLVIICANAYQHDVGVSCIINGEHMRGSLHKSGQAIDLDVLGENSNLELVRFLKPALPSVFDVVLEATHVHVEYQPK